jgi:LCP family protein required for cell wall assembly
MSSLPFPFSALRPLRPRRAPVLAFIGVCLLLIPIGTLVMSSRARLAVIRGGLTVAGASVERDASGHTNLLLLGVGGDGHDGGDLTDAMMLVSMDPSETRSVVLLSLPRDLYIGTAGDLPVRGRINALYFLWKSRLRREGVAADDLSRQALSSVARSISEQLQVPIHGVVKADFTAFVQTVDALGGVDVDVPAPIIDRFYPVAPGRIGTFRIEAGPQHLDGETALRYARSRYSTDDFDRSARQQILLHALTDKVRSLGRIGQMTFLLRLSQTLQGHIETTLTREQLLGLAQIATSLSRDRVLTFQLNYHAGGTTQPPSPGAFVLPAPAGTFDGASILVPASPSGRLDDWSGIRTFVHLVLFHRPLYLAHPRIVIRHLPAARPAAQRLQHALLCHGLAVEPLQALTADDAFPSDGSVVRYDNVRWERGAETLATLADLPVARGRDATTGTGDILFFLDGTYRFTSFALRGEAVQPEAGTMQQWFDAVRR